MLKFKHYLIACALLMLYGQTHGQGGITVSAGTKVTVEAATTLGVGSGNLLLKDDLNSSPSFLEKGSLVFSGGGQAYVEQYLTKDAWHIVSPSVGNEVNGAYMWMYLYNYNEPDNSWAFMNQPVNQPLNPGQGYFVWPYTVDPNGSSPPSPDSAVLNGALNKTDVALTLSNTAASPKSGWNLLGNPYPCSIDWNGNWAVTNVGTTVYLYDNSITGNYQTWNWNTGIGTNGKTNGNIAAGQGFWVRAADTMGVATSLTVPQAERLHSPQPFLKSALDKMLRLNVAGNSGSDETVIAFSEESTQGFDSDMDAYHLAGNGNAPEMYSVGGNAIYAVNLLPDIEGNEQVSVNFKAKEEGVYHIDASSIESFSSDIPIWLEDKKENTFRDLRQNTGYGFSAGPADQAGRFVVHFSNPLGTGGASNQETANIYAFGKTVYIDMPVNSINGGQCIVYDMTGNRVASQKVSQGKNTVPVPFNKGYYVVALITANGKTMTRKVFIK